MAKLKKNLQAVTRQLKVLARKTESLAKKVDKLEKAQAAKKPKVKPKAKNTAKKKKTPAKKKAPVKKKAGKPTASDQVLNIIKRSKKGVDVSTLIKKTEIDENKIRNVISRAFMLKKIKRARRGVYVGA